MIDETEKIYRTQAAEELQISIASLNRAVRTGELRYANPNDPKGKHRYFTRADLENYRRIKNFGNRKTADLVQKILNRDLPLKDSPLAQMAQQYLYPLPLDIVVEIETISPRRTRNIYAYKFPLISREFSSSAEHAAAVLALAHVIHEHGGLCKSRDFTQQSSWGPSANQAIQDNADNIRDRAVAFAHAWFADGGVFSKVEAPKLLRFLCGNGDGNGSPGKCIQLDWTCLYTNFGYGQDLFCDIKTPGTRVVAHLVTPLP